MEDHLRPPLRAPNVSFREAITRSATSVFYWKHSTCGLAKVRLLGLLEGRQIQCATDSNGSSSADRARDVIAGKLTLNMNDREADVRGGQWTTHLRPSPNNGPSGPSSASSKRQECCNVRLRQLPQDIARRALSDRLDSAGRGPDDFPLRLW